MEVQQPILVLQSEEQSIYPPEVRYREHFAYWESWQSDLIKSLGQVRKRDITYLNGAIGELRSLRELLTGPPAERLSQILEELVTIQEKWMKAPEPWGVAPPTHSRLAQIQREIEKKMPYSKVKKWVPPGKSSSPKP